MRKQKTSNSELKRKNSFTVLKQKDGGGPVYKVEVCSRTLEILSKEPLIEVPTHWSLDEFYSMWDEGKRLNIELN